MIQVFDEAPSGLQAAPHDPRVLAAGYQVALREVNFTEAHDKDSLMLAFLAGLALTDHFGRNWDALYDALTDPDARPARLALLLCDYAAFRERQGRLSAELEGVLLDAQAEAARRGRQLYLLTEEPDSTTKLW